MQLCCRDSRVKNRNLSVGSSSLTRIGILRRKLNKEVEVKDLFFGRISVCVGIVSK